MSLRLNDAPTLPTGGGCCCACGGGAAYTFGSPRSATITLADATPTVTPNALPGATEGQPVTAQIGTITDPDSGGSATDFVAAIDWGDGKPATTGTVTPLGAAGASRIYAVIGTHVYDEESSQGYVVTVSVRDVAGGSAWVSASGPATAVQDAPLTASGPVQAVHTTEGVPLDLRVATFTDADPGTAADPTTDPGDYRATIDWGDGTGLGTGSIAAVAGTAGQFAVTGAHTYSDEPRPGDPPYRVVVTIADRGGASTSTAFAADVADAWPIARNLRYRVATNATLRGKVTANDASEYDDFPVTARITRPALHGQVTLLDANTGAFVYRPAPGYVGFDRFRYQDTNADGTGGNVATVQISVEGVPMGAGPPTWPTFGPDPGDPPDPVLGPNPILFPGTDPGTGPGQDPLDTPLLPGPGRTLSLVEGQPFGGAVASFTDPDPPGVPADNVATIDWGDGSAPTTLAVGAGGDIRGNHTYAEEGTYHGSASITDPDGGGGIALSFEADVADATISANFAAPTQFVEGQSFGGTVATFTDADRAAPASDFTATVDWGDGSPPTTVTAAGGGIVALGDGSFAVDAAHTYEEEQASSLPITITIVDGGGSTATVTGTGTVADAPLGWVGGPTFAWSSPLHPAPGLTNPGDRIDAEGALISLPVQVSETDGDSLTFGADNLPAGLSINSTTGRISGTIDSDAAETEGGVYRVTVGATDSQGSVAAQTFTWTITDTPRPPILANPGDRSNADGDAVDLALAASDPDGNPLTFSATGLPSGLSIDPATGAITGTLDPAADANGPYAVTVTADDGNGHASQAFTWAVGVGAVTFTPTGDQVDSVGDTIDLPIQAGDPQGTALTFSATGLPTGLAIDPNTGDISGTLDAAAAAGSPYAVTVTATDGTRVASEAFRWVATRLALANPGAQADAPGDVVALQLTASDPGGHTLAYSATGLPAGLSIDPTDGLISGTVAAAAATDAAVTVTVTNGVDTLSRSFAWTVLDATGIRQQVLAGPSDQGNVEGDVVDLPTVVGDGSAPPLALTFTATGLPAGLTIDPHLGLIAGTVAPGAAAAGPYAITVTATHGTYVATETFHWVVTHFAVVNPGDQSNAPGDSVSLQVQASDADGDTLTYSAAGLPSGLAINPASGLISGTIVATTVTEASYDVTASASDGSTVVSNSFRWTVTNTQQPIALTSPGDQRSRAGNEVSVQIQANDPDRDTLTFDAAGLPAGLFINPGTGLIGGVASYLPGVQPAVVIVTVDDGAGNTASLTFDWRIDPPNLSAQGVAVNAVAGDSVTPLEVASLANPADPAGDPAGYVAMIAWGDGTTSAGTVVDPGDGSLQVEGSHAYAASGHYQVSTTATYAGDVTVTTTSAATVTAASISAAGVHVETIVGDARPVAVATFTDTDRDANPADFTAVIAWGDGATSAGTIAGLDGDWVVSGSHAYAAHGTPTVAVTITDKYGDTATASVDAKVGDVYEGATSSLSVVAFADADPHGGLADYTATIDWGDGSSQLTVPGAGGTITFEPGVGFVVSGTHRYAEAATDTVKVTVRDAGGSTLDGQRDVVVADAPLAARGHGTLAVSSGQPFSGEIATFTDANPRGQVGDYRATISWGDGSTSQGTIAPDPAIPGLFHVAGDHTYAVPDASGHDSTTQAGTFQVKVAIEDYADPADAVAEDVAVEQNAQAKKTLVLFLNLGGQPGTDAGNRFGLTQADWVRFNQQRITQVRDMLLNVYSYNYPDSSYDELARRFDVANNRLRLARRFGAYLTAIGNDPNATEVDRFDAVQAAARSYDEYLQSLIEVMIVESNHLAANPHYYWYSFEIDLLNRVQSLPIQVSGIELGLTPDESEKLQQYYDISTFYIEKAAGDAEFNVGAMEGALKGIVIGGVFIAMAAFPATAPLALDIGAALLGASVGSSLNERWNQGQSAAEIGSGTLADVTGFNALYVGLTGRDAATGQVLNLTPGQKGAQFGSGLTALALTITGAAANNGGSQSKTFNIDPSSWARAADFLSFRTLTTPEGVSVPIPAFKPIAIPAPTTLVTTVATQLGATQLIVYMTAPDNSEPAAPLFGEGVTGSVREESLPREVQDTIDMAVQGGLPSKQFRNKYSGKPGGPLPEGTYEEYDVPVPRGGGEGRGQRRVIFERSTGRAYYSSNFHEGSVGVSNAAKFVEIENPGMQ